MIVRAFQLQQIPYPRSPSITLRTNTGGSRVIGGFQVEANTSPSKASRDYAFVEATRGLSSHSTHASHPPYGYIQSLFLTTKATQAEDAVGSLVAGGRISSATTIVLLTNGIGVYERLVRTFFRDVETRPQFVLATNTHGAVRNETFDVRHTASGQIHYGVLPDPLGRDQSLPTTVPLVTAHSAGAASDPPDPDPFFSLHRTIHLLDTLSPHLSVTREPLPHLQQRLLLKLVINCCVNPLTALNDYPNGAILEDLEARRTIREICHEAAAVLLKQAEQHDEEDAAAGLVDHSTMFPTTGLADETIEEREARMARVVNRRPFRRTPTAGDLGAEVLRVINLTSGNTSSMLQDVRRGKKTEIEFINGALSAFGREYGVPTPCNDALADMLREKEARTLRAHQGA